MEQYVPSPLMLGDVWYTLVSTEEKLGLRFNGVEITTVSKDSWAAREGVEIDDEICEVNGVAFGGKSSTEQLDLLKGARPMSIKFKRPIVKDTYYELSLNEDKVGMGFKGSRVSTVRPEGWAARCGILVNDEIAEVNGTGFSQLKEAEKVKLFKMDRPITLKLKRPAATIHERVSRGETPELPGIGLARVPTVAMERAGPVVAKSTILPSVGSSGMERAPSSDEDERLLLARKPSALHPDMPDPVFEGQLVTPAGWFFCCSAAGSDKDRTATDFNRARKGVRS